MTDFEDARRKMVESQLRTENVTDRGLLAAMGAVPREVFVPARLRSLAYIDRDLTLKEAGETGPERLLMEPAPFARLAQLATLSDDDFVLDIGCASGYSAAVLARLSDSVVALESDGELAAQASDILTDLEVDNAAVVVGELEAGYPAEGPYDAIVLGGSVEFVPDSLVDQLKDGGRLVAVIGRGRSGQATILTKSGGQMSSRTAFDADVPALPGFLRPVTFVL